MSVRIQFFQNRPNVPYRNGLILCLCINGQQINLAVFALSVTDDPIPAAFPFSHIRRGKSHLKDFAIQSGYRNTRHVAIFHVRQQFPQIVLHIRVFFSEFSQLAPEGMVIMILISRPERPASLCGHIGHP